MAGAGSEVCLILLTSFVFLTAFDIHSRFIKSTASANQTEMNYDNNSQSRDRSNTLDIGEICEVWYLRYDLREYVRFIKEVSKNGTFASTKSLVIVGPGSAFAEMLFMEASMPSLEKLTIVEPDAKCVEKLKIKFGEEIPSVSVRYVTGRMEDWNGPEEKVDMVMMIESLHEFKSDDSLVVFKRIFDHWLKPGGCLFFGLDDETSVYNSVLLETFPNHQVVSAQQIIRDVKMIPQVRKLSDHAFEFQMDLRATDDGFFQIFENEIQTLIHQNFDSVQVQVRNSFNTLYGGKETVGEWYHYI